MHKVSRTITLLLLPAAALAAPPASDVLIERAGVTGFVRVDAQSFAALDEREKQLAYWLSQAAIATDPIVYDQFSHFGLRQKRLLEGIVAYTAPTGSDPLRVFALQFWANRGNHNDTTSQKLEPGFSFEQLRAAAHAAQAKGAFVTRYGDLPALTSAAQLDQELAELRASFFDPAFEPMETAKSPGPGKDLLQSSANNFYHDLSEADLKDFKDHYALNSLVVRGADGKLQELVYRAGTADGRVPAGRGAVYMRRAIECLEQARKLAEPAQAQAIADLINYFRTGEFSDWVKFGTDWVQNNPRVDFDIGFVEIYHDVRGAKGSSQAFVSVTDAHTTELISRLAANAAYFEARAPWDEKYKRKSFKAPLVKAIETLVETGDFPVTTIGDNLPNENAIHEKYGSKNFLFISSTRAINAASGHAVAAEFYGTPEMVARDAKVGEEAANLLTAMHEVIGHGSGALSERLKGGAAPYLKEYFSTLEEGRADLMAMWNVWDPKLKELGLISDQEEVAKALYDRQLLAPLTQLRMIPTGSTVEEDHQRDRQLIVNFIRDRAPGAIEQFDRDGKTYLVARDYQKMRQGVGALLAELMRIKAEGDYAAIKKLIDQYAVHFDPALRDQIVARYRKLGLPTYWAGVNARLTAHGAEHDAIGAVHLSYPTRVEDQYLAYGAVYDASLARALAKRPP